MDAPNVKITVRLRPEVPADVHDRFEAGVPRSVSAYVELAVVGQVPAKTDFDMVLAKVSAGSDLTRPV